MDVKPSTMIRHHYSDFSKYCHDIDEPVVLTRNGEVDLVVMSFESFRRMEARFKLRSKLLLARDLAEDVNGARFFIQDHDQQGEKKSRRIEDRIVSISQPHVRSCAGKPEQMWNLGPSWR